MFKSNQSPPSVPPASSFPTPPDDVNPDCAPLDFSRGCKQRVEAGSATNDHVSSPSNPTTTPVLLTIPRRPQPKNLSTVFPDSSHASPTTSPPILATSSPINSPLPFFNPLLKSPVTAPHFPVGSGGPLLFPPFLGFPAFLQNLIVGSLTHQQQQLEESRTNQQHFTPPLCHPQDGGSVLASRGLSPGFTEHRPSSSKGIKSEIDRRTVDSDQQATSPEQQYGYHPETTSGHYEGFRQQMLQQLSNKKKPHRQVSPTSTTPSSTHLLLGRQNSCDSSLSQSPSPTFQPDQDQDQKEAAYLERRRKNNLAAKRSRDARRAKEDEIAIRAAFLEQENVKLKWEMARLKAETTRLRTLLLTDSDEGIFDDIHMQE